MPIHLEELDVVSEVEGTGSALIAACNMCAGASLAMDEDKPFLQFFGSLLKSPPLERYIGRLKSQLLEKGVKTTKFEAGVIQQFFLCLWIVLGCDSAIKTVRDSVNGTNCRVIKGMEVAGIMNTKTKFHWPFDISFEYSKVVPMCDHHCERFSQHSQ
jgi:hypothetical protein